MDRIGIEGTSNIVAQWVKDLLATLGLSDTLTNLLYVIVMIAILAVTLLILMWLIRHILHFALSKIANISAVPFFERLVQNKFAYYLTLVIPYSLVKYGVTIIFAEQPTWIEPLSNLVDIYLVFMVIWLIKSIIRSCIDLLKVNPNFQHKPLASYQQVVMGIIYLFGLVVIYSILTGKSPVGFFTAMGAASAVLLLVFKDSLMGLMASVQITTSDIVRIDDWITVPKYGADGDVIEINLTTVKVRNFDKTITTLPTYALIADSFQNWRGMQVSGGRRIKRCITVKQSSIKYIYDNELEKYQKIQGIKDYIETRSAEIKAHNERINADRSLLVNGRNLTNAGLYRQYTKWYLEHHPGINPNMTLMVRHLAPTEKGLPFEVYTFTNTTNWVEYEGIMADIFDHLIAAVKYFDLEIFELESTPYTK